MNVSGIITAEIKQNKKQKQAELDRSPIDASVLFPQGLRQRDEEDGQQMVVGGGW